ncbi:four helix bundle protein [Candidatus Falkowbacteria bacterium]|nr:four helix bundle protein [Candidatus Falkowbacteria bacterium]
MTQKGYQDLIVWQKGFALVVAVYTLTNQLPKNEMFGLVSQLRRSAVSIPSNIAEGYGRKSDAEFNRFLLIAKGSLFELETQLLLVKKLNLIPNYNTAELDQLLIETSKLIYAFLKKLGTRD